MRAARDVVAMGDMMIGNWPVKDTEFGSGETTRSMIGMAIRSIGNKTLIDVGSACGHATLAATAQAQSDAFETKAAAYKVEVRSHIDATDVFDSY